MITDIFKIIMQPYFVFSATIFLRFFLPPFWLPVEEIKQRIWMFYSKFLHGWKKKAQMYILKEEKQI